MNIFEFVAWACSGSFWRFAGATILTLPLGVIVLAVFENLLKTVLVMVTSKGPSQ